MPKQKGSAKASAAVLREDVDFLQVGMPGSEHFHKGEADRDFLGRGARGGAP